MAEVLDPSAGWTKQSHGASVTTLHAVLEGHQLLPSDPRFGGNVKAHAVGVYYFPCVDNPNARITHSVAEETFGDGIWETKSHQSKAAIVGERPYRRRFARAATVPLDSSSTSCYGRACAFAKRCQTERLESGAGLRGRKIPRRRQNKGHGQ
eukprot:2647210-Pyramimonas_sp.AAC.1